MSKQDPDHRCLICDKRCGSSPYCGQCESKDPDYKAKLNALSKLDNDELTLELKIREQKITPWHCLRCNGSVEDPEFIICDPCTRIVLAQKT
jgi:hypothetical protein